MHKLEQQKMPSLVEAVYINAGSGSYLSQDSDTDNTSSSDSCANSVKNESSSEIKNSTESCFRLQESKLFDINLAIICHIQGSKKKGIQDHIGQRMFNLDDKDVDFLLPQLLTMYIHRHKVAEAIHPYIVHRCMKSIEFRIRTAWLLEAYTANLTSEKSAQCVKLTTMITTGEGSEMMKTQLDFVNSLMIIGNNLAKLPTKELRSSGLTAELAKLNQKLPARVWLPIQDNPNHHIVRIADTESVVLNSKEKVPYILYVEVVSCDNIATDPVPSDNMSNDIYRNIPESSIDPAGTLHNTSDVAAVITPDKGGSCSSEAHMAVVSVSNEEVYFTPGQIRRRLSENIEAEEKDRKDPSYTALKEPWNDKVQRIKNTSPYGHLPGWNLMSVIVKCGDDLRQELMVSQILKELKSIWAEECLPLWIRPYNIIVTSDDCGMIEPVTDAISLHQIKKNSGLSLKEYFLKEFGSSNSEKFIEAQRNFIHSCAGYSLMCYLLQLKDRHNGNILLDNQGRIIHIDFGFILSTSPGGNLSFENSPFKLTDEYVEVMGGVGSDSYEEYKLLMLKGLIAARKHMHKIIPLVEIMKTGSNFPCFDTSVDAVQQLRDRFWMGKTDEQLKVSIHKMVESCRISMTTGLYDRLQYLQNGIY